MLKKMMNMTMNFTPDKMIILNEVIVDAKTSEMHTRRMLVRASDVIQAYERNTKRNTYVHVVLRNATGASNIIEVQETLAQIMTRVNMNWDSDSNHLDPEYKEMYY